MTLPNIVSLVRLLAVPAVVWLVLKGHFAAGFWGFAAVALTDALDGILARTLKAHTALGAMLDPLADKALLVSLYVTLGALGLVPVWLPLLVVARDVLLIGGVVVSHLMWGPGGEIRPLFVSKLNTTLQAVLVGVVLAREGLALPLDGVVAVGTLAVGATTLVSGLWYVVRWVLELEREA